MMKVIYNGRKDIEKVNYPKYSDKIEKLFKTQSAYDCVAILPSKGSKNGEKIAIFKGIPGYWNARSFDRIAISCEIPVENQIAHINVLDSNGYIGIAKKVKAVRKLSDCRYHMADEDDTTYVVSVLE